MNKYKDSINYFLSEPDEGLYDAMNKGFKKSNGDVVCFLNSDDVYSDNLVLKDVADSFVLKNSCFVYGDIDMVDSNNTVCRKWIAGKMHYLKYLGLKTLPHPAFFVSKHELLKLDTCFDYSYKIAADIKQQLILLHKNKINGSYINRSLVKMRIGGESTKNFSSFLKSWKESAQAYSEVFGGRGYYFALAKSVSKIKGIRKGLLFNQK